MLACYVPTDTIQGEFPFSDPNLETARLSISVKAEPFLCQTQLQMDESCQASSSGAPAQLGTTPGLAAQGDNGELCALLSHSRAADRDCQPTEWCLTAPVPITEFQRA